MVAEKAASQKDESADGGALGLGPGSLERQKHTLASYFMCPNAVRRQPTTGTWLPTSGLAPQRQRQAVGGTCLAPVPKNCSRGHHAVLAFRQPMHTILELVRHANRTTLVSNTTIHQLPLMQQSLDL